MDMTPRFSSTNTGDQPAALEWISWPSSPSIRGTLGPQMSMSSKPTCAKPRRAVVKAKAANLPLDSFLTPSVAAEAQEQGCTSVALCRSCLDLGWECLVHKGTLTSLPEAARAKASCAAKVLLPTPPLPERTNILCLIARIRAAMAALSGSGPLGAEAQAAWLGQPAQEGADPA